jgi:hypothetical protein
MPIPPTTLHQRSHRDAAAGAGDLLQVDLQADHEKQEDQPQFGNRGDGLLR